jgi:hypothetical protein
MEQRSPPHFQNRIVEAQMSVIAINSGSRTARSATLRVLSGIPRKTSRDAARRWTPVVIRLGLAADEQPLRRLAQLDSARPLNGQTLLAEQSGAIIAAMSLSDAATIADPFTPTADAVALLRLRAQQLDGVELSAA